MKLRSLRYLFVEGLKNVWINRLMSIASIGVLSACMILMGAATLFSLNVEKALGTLENQNVVMAYIADGTSKEDSQIAVQKIQNLDNVKQAIFISKQAGMNKMVKDMGDQYTDLFKWLDDEKGSFLPDGIQISFKDLTQYDQTIVQIKAIKNVDHINDSRELTMQIVGMKKMVTVAGMWIIGLLLLTALVIITNTIKITMHTRKLEISIMKAVGATNNFIRLPFVVEGMVLGIISAATSIGLLYFAYNMTLKQLVNIMTVSEVSFSSVVWWMMGAFCLIGILAGCIGSVISIGKYLKREGSEFRAF